MFKEFGIKSKGNCGDNNFRIKSDNGMITNASDLSELFNNYFVNIASKLKGPIINSDLERLYSFVRSKVPNVVSFNITLINVEFVRKFLSN